MEVGSVLGLERHTADAVLGTLVTLECYLWWALAEAAKHPIWLRPQEEMIVGRTLKLRILLADKGLW